jgi:hypothetical protein
MALFRQVLRSPALFRQCSRLVAANQQQQRGNADIAFTFASTSDVSKWLNKGNYCYTIIQLTIQTYTTVTTTINSLCYNFGEKMHKHTKYYPGTKCVCVIQLRVRFYRFKVKNVTLYLTIYLHQMLMQM